MALATALGAGIIAAAPAHATVSDVDAGGAITRSMVLERAYSWAAEAVPYSQSDYYPSSAPRTGVGHSYRQDCSGFLSMAWDLPTSALTGDFVSSTSPYDTQLPSWSQLMPGDLLGVSYHVVLFLGWSADDAGRHRYFDMASESTSGHPAAVSLDQDAQGYWAPYVPYRYRNIVNDPTSSISWGGSRVDSVALDAAGHVQHSWQAAAGAKSYSEDLTAAHRFPVLRTAPTIASRGSGQLDVVGTSTDGAIYDFSYAAGSGWVSHALTASGTTYGLSATSEPGRVDLYARLLGRDGPGTLVHTWVTPTSLAQWSTAGGSSDAVDDPAAVRNGLYEIDSVVETATGSLLFGTWDGATWTWTAAFGTTKVATRPQLSRYTDGAMVLTATVGSALEQSTRAPGATAWSTFHPASAVPVTGTADPAGAVVLPRRWWPRRGGRRVVA